MECSSLGNSKLTSAGSLLHNSSNSLISYFSLSMGIASNNIAELGVVRRGLLLAWDLGFKFIHLEIDSMTILSWLTTNHDISPDDIPLFHDCRNLMEHDWTIQVCHIFYEANGWADALGKRGNQQQYFLEIYDTCLAFVYVPFVWDMENLGTTRMCPLKVVMPVVIWTYI